MTEMNGKGGKRVSPPSQAGARPSHGNVCRARGGMVSVGPGRRTAAAATREPDPKARLHVLRLRRPGRPNILGTSQAAGSPRCRRRLVHEATCRPLPLLPSSPPPLCASHSGEARSGSSKGPRAREGVLAVRTWLCLRVPIDTMRGWDEGPQQLLGVPGTIPPLRGNSKARQTQDEFVGDIV